MAQPRAADDFVAIHARLEELKRERENAEPNEDVQRNKEVGRLDESRWQVADELRARALARRKWPPR